MNSAEKLIALQLDSLEIIEKAHVNYKKSPKERITLGYVQGRLENLEINYKEFKNIHQKLITSVSKEDKDKMSYFSEDLYDTFEERYYIYKGELKTTLHKFYTETKDSQVVQNTSSNHASSSEIKLPRITIPTFNGDYTEWQSFHDLFTTLIHNNSALDDVQRMHYIKVNLKGDAEYLLRQFSITADNYKQAWSILKKRYDNKRYIANCHFRRFFGQRTIVKESANALKQLLDTSVECLNALKTLGLPVTQWDSIVIYIIVSKLDSDSHKHWEELINGEDSTVFPTFEKLKSFLETRFRTLEMVEPDTKGWKSIAPKTFHVTASEEYSDIQCAFCKEDHYIFNCKQFAKQSLDDRYNFVRDNSMCFNCLIPNHSVWRCRQKTSCQICKKRHHSLLHRDSKLAEEQQENKKADMNAEDSKLVAHVRPSEEQTEESTMLATALVTVASKCGQPQICRAFIDPGSEISFVTARVVELLNLKKTPISGVVSVIEEGNDVYVKSKVELQISSRYEPDYTVKVNAYVLKSITRSLPAREINCKPWPQLDDVKLADPNFDTPGKVDILLGAGVYGRIIESGLMKGPGYLVAQYTRLGWIVTGDTNTTSYRPSRVASFHVIRQVEEDNNLLKKFWEVETQDYTNMKGWSKEEELCEEIYKTTTTRDDIGRYIVHLPLKESVEDTVKSCGETKQQAIWRFKQLERRFEKNETLKTEYRKVIEEYLELGHMMKAETEEDGAAVYLPHHAVVKETRDTTKVRIVFDASAKGSHGNSLNNAMMIGPTLQPGLRSLVIRWRSHKFCVIGDVVKMYRQIWMTPKHTDLQRIVWRDTPSEKIESYKLLTVTFGTAAAPYLAVRTLSQLADDEAQTYPRAAPVVKNSFYMDDLMTGHEDESEIKKLCQEINSLLKEGGLEMQKWSSNSEELLEFLRDGKTCEEPENKIEIKLDKIIKILGLTWDRKEDIFKITVNLPDSNVPTTKRQIISEVASLFDPFGWLAPVVITAKIMIQRLWLYSLSWDDELPPEIIQEWQNYREELNQLQTIQIPRWIRTTSGSKDIQLHGFADASSVAYGAVVYLRVIDEEDIVHVSMLAAKTKVAPLKQLTIPRLELCAAVLTARLLREMSDLLNVSMDNCYAWTDSMVVLSWLQCQPSRWQLFVGNRVSDIIQHIDNDKWRHVQSADNPADLVSRGVNAKDIANSEMWWTGPKWLKGEKIDFERTRIPGTDLEVKRTFHTRLEEKSIWERFSSFTKLKRVLAWCFRFLSHTAGLNRERFLTTVELNEIERRCIKYYQWLVYNQEIEDLKESGKIKKKSSLISLAPYLDENGLLRVGGRLKNAQISENEKHPIIIPNNQHITRLLVNEAHIRTLHGDIQQMMTYIRSKYWIISLKSSVRQATRNCKICIIDKARTHQQLMGQLPAPRVTSHRAFLNSGVDYAGPIQLKTSKGRGYKTMKGYICLFVCMSTRAIHLEAVTDLTAQAFIAAFRRFVARRGHCAHLWSDNGTNFKGAAKELKHMFSKGKINIASQISELLANDGTTWHFIPPRAPNFGGLWEAGVRSMKRHLNRVSSTTKMTYEEMSTLLAQIEGCLNSRPLCKMDETLATLNPLTPGHFLIGEPLITVPEADYEDRNVNLLTRWQFIQNRMQDFWRRWKVEYLNTLQQRYKWHETVKSPSVGDIVIVKEDDIPPAKWLLGKIEDLHPGADNLVRVVTLKCKGGNLIKRPLSKLILLPSKPA